MKKRGTSAFFLVFWAHSKAVSRCIKNEAEGHRAFFFAVFAQLQKRCHAASKMKQRDTGPFFFFCHFVAHSKAVPRCIKNEAERHRALVKHRDARAGERHQLVGHQMNEQVRHRAVGHVLPRVGQQVDLGARVVVPKRAHEFREGARRGDVVLRHAVRDAGLLCAPWGS